MADDEAEQVDVEALGGGEVAHVELGVRAAQDVERRRGGAGGKDAVDR